MNTFGERLKLLRKEKSISVAELSELVRMTPDAVLKIESGKRGRTFEKLPRIAKALGCRIDDLFPEMDEVQPAEPDFPEGWKM